MYKLKNTYFFGVYSCYFLSVLLFPNSIFGSETSYDYSPQRIILNITEYPAHSMAVTWRTNKKVDSPYVQVSIAKKSEEFVADKIIYNASTEEFFIDSSRCVYHYSAIISELESGVKYVYRVGSDSAWSEWNQFNTAYENSEDFKFVYFGDPQNDIKEHCSRVFRESFKKVPDAAFWLFAGDITTDPVDELWSELFDAAGFIFAMTPAVMAPGNHDHTAYYENGKKKRGKIIDPIWNAHLTQPKNGLKGLEEISFYYDYQGVRFVILETTDRLDEQAVWLDEILSENPNRWTIVSMHYPIYSTGKGRDNQYERELLQPVFDKHNVDLVLQGHDHVYGRTYKIKNGNVVKNDESGTVYVVSVSGTKSYELNTLFCELMAKTETDIQLFQEVSISKSSLSYKAYTADGLLFDSFELNKN